MRVDSITQSANESIFKSISKGRFAKDLVLKWFKTIELGSITIVDGSEIYRFGEKNLDSNSDLAATIVVEHPDFYSAILVGGAIGSGESYMRGHWSSPNLVDAVRVLARNLAAIEKLESKSQLLPQLFLKLYSLLTLNTINGSKRNIAAHYDLGNDFFSLFLDPTMMYSAGIWENEEAGLEQASINKLDTICQKLNLSESDHLIEIGTGWGGFAIHAARTYGCRVSTTTISKQQYDYACQQVEKQGLQDKVNVLMQDYRELSGQYDKLVSIEMIEAVGHKYMPSFFEKCSSLLKDNGAMLLQSITISDQRYDKARQSVDFIQRYIFPGGCLPSNAEIVRHLAQKTDMQLADLHDITHDYSLTLQAWAQRFSEQYHQVCEQGFNDVFVRMWHFYLAYCEGAFRERAIQTSQFLMLKPQASLKARLLR